MQFYGISFMRPYKQSVDGRGRLEGPGLIDGSRSCNNMQHVGIIYVKFN